MAETKKKTTTNKTTQQTKSANNTSPKKTTTKTTQNKSANQKTETKKTTTKPTTQKQHKKTIMWGLNKISFYCIGAMAIFYLIASILSLCGITSAIVPALQGIATALAISIVAFVAWKYVRNKQMVWKVLYFVLLLVVLLGIILPMALIF